MWSWEKLKDGDRQAQEEFALEFGPYATKRLRALGFQEADAEDYSSEGIMAVLQRASKFEPREPVEQMFRGWAWTVTYNLAESWRRSYRPDLLGPLPDHLASEGAAYNNDPLEARRQRAEDEQEQEMRLERLRSMVRCLPQKYRQIIERKAFEGEATFEQVAAILQIAPGTARQRYHRAVHLLRKLVSEDKGL